MFLSVFDLFKIGIGPSSSHTMGPMVAASRFLDELRDGDWPRPSGMEVEQIRVSLHGSLAFTGKGHGSDRAVILGLMGQLPDTLEPDAVDALVAKANDEKRLSAQGHPAYYFDPEKDLVFDFENALPGHANGMTYLAFGPDNKLMLRRVYYSIGGGFVVDEGELADLEKSTEPETIDVPYPFSSADEMLDMASQSGLSIAQMKRANEEKISNRASLSSDIADIWRAMNDCIERGLRVEGELPGGLSVKRRAKQMHEKLEKTWSQNMADPMAANNWASLFAISVNEENAAGGKVVTAPTNGAAGVVPAVIKYYLKFVPGASEQGVEDFLLTAAAIGGIIKSNASISGAEVGCQGEVGSAAAMAAAGLAAALGATPEQIENAAEIALEHHLGMTCDPVAGLVQVPCIERNALGAVKALTAASLAIHGDGTHFVPLDSCIETMRQTGADMNANYKETSLGGLAVNVVEC